MMLKGWDGRRGRRVREEEEEEHVCGCSGPYHDCIVTGTAYRCKHVLQPRISPLKVDASLRTPASVAPCR